MDAAAVAKTFNKDLLKGKVAFVTGGGSGIGQDIAIQLATYGANVAVMGRRKDKLQDTLSKIKQSTPSQGLALEGDVRNSEHADKAIQDILKTFGRLDILVNCAAGNFLAAAEQLSTNAFRTVMEIDAIGSFNMSRAAFKALKRETKKLPEHEHATHIINISATLQMYAKWYQVHASAAKSAIDSMTRSLALEWGSYGIRVMGVAPGPVGDTVGYSKLVGDVDESDISSSIPLGRASTKSDISASVLFLVSPAATIMTGSTIIVDGGDYLYDRPSLPREQLQEWSRAKEKKTRAPNAKL